MGNQLTSHVSSTGDMEVNIAGLRCLDPVTSAYVQQVISLLARRRSDFQAAILFGSIARGTARSLTHEHPSDVDLLVLLASSGDQRTLSSDQHAAVSWASIDALDLIPDAPRDVQITVALTTFAGWDASFIANVAREGILLWARGPLPDVLRPIMERHLPG